MQFEINRILLGACFVVDKSHRDVYFEFETKIIAAYALRVSVSANADSTRSFARAIAR